MADTDITKINHIRDSINMEVAKITKKLLVYEKQRLPLINEENCFLSLDKLVVIHGDIIILMAVCFNLKNNLSNLSNDRIYQSNIKRLLSTIDEATSTYRSMSYALSEQISCIRSIIKYRFSSEQ